MWICKKCGSELKKIIGIRYLSHVTMLKDGYPTNNKEKYNKELEENKIKFDEEFLGVECTNCDEKGIEAEDIGIWKPLKRRW